jgi:UrcA family protein
MATATAKLSYVRRSLAVAGAFAALTVATTSIAAASSDDSPPSVSVRYDDLDLSSTAGANVLYHRISVAARQVCPDLYSRDLEVVAVADRCYASAVSKAVAEVNNPHLAMVHATHVSHG